MLDEEGTIGLPGGAGEHVAGIPPPRYRRGDEGMDAADGAMHG